MGRIAGSLFVVLLCLASSAVAEAQTCSPPCAAGETCVDGVCEPVPAQCSPPCGEGFACSGGLCVAVSSTTDDESDGERMTPRSWRLKVRVAFGGELTVGDATDALDPTLGVAVERYWSLSANDLVFSIGGVVSGLWWRTQAASDAGIGRNLLVELAFVPRVSYRLQPGLFVYAGVPVGLTMSILHADFADDPPMGFGWNLSALAGVQYDMELLGIFAEAGVDLHSFSHTIDTGFGEVGVDYDFTQFAFDVGIAF